MIADTLSLAAVGPGKRVRVRAVRAGGNQTRRLRELGVLEGKTLQIVTKGDPLICQVGDGRFGLCRRLARCVFVEPVAQAVAKSA